MPSDPYVSDAPVASREHDRLQRWPFAERIADTLATRSDPSSLVVGVYGRWGEGKTTVLQFIEQRLAEHDDVILVRFNPWLFTSDTDLFLSFFAQVAGAIDRKLKTRTERLGEFLTKYGGLVSGLSWAVGDFRAGAGTAATKLGEELAKVSPAELRARLEEGLAEAGKRVVVLLDDIDRLDKDEAQAVFRLLKVAADFDWTSYVLAFDREIVAEALSERYPRRENGGDDFLDKIVQVPLPLPPIPREVLRRLLFEDINRVLDDSEVELSDRDVHRFTTEFDLRLLGYLDTPRAAKRYVNALQFALPLLRGEVDTVDLLLIEALRVFQPRLHQLVVRRRDMVLNGGRDRSKEEVEAFKADMTALVGTGESARHTLQLLQGLFPRLKSIYSNYVFGPESDARWAREKRIASERYFDRYFASGVPAGDIADGTVRELVLMAQTDEDGAAEGIRQALANVGADRLVQKLIDVALGLDPSVSLPFARALLRAGVDFPHPPGAFADYMGPRGRAALLASLLLVHVEAPRDEAIAGHLHLADLPFALHVFRRLQPKEAEDDPNARGDSLSETEWRALGALLLPRVWEDARERWPFDAGIAEGGLRISMMREFGPVEDARGYVEAAIRNEAPRALDIVRYFSGGGRSLTSGERIQDPIRADGYERLHGLVDPDVLAKSLRDVYGEPESLEVVTDMHVNDDAELARSFLALHAQPRPDAAGDAEPATHAATEEGEA